MTNWSPALAQMALACTDRAVTGDELAERRGKVTAEHLRRDAYLYVRQSTLWQVLTNTESAHPPVRAAQRAIALGWPVEQVVVIDVDQGQSGASRPTGTGSSGWSPRSAWARPGSCSAWRCSRLARNNADWHRLLELCAITDTLICDEDGLYDPGDVQRPAAARA